MGAEKTEADDVDDMEEGEAGEASPADVEDGTGNFLFEIDKLRQVIKHSSWSLGVCVSPIRAATKGRLQQ